MADMVVQTNESVSANELLPSNLPAGSRVVVVIDPDSLTVGEGTLVYDATVPTGKILNGRVTLSGDIIDAE